MKIGLLALPMLLLTTSPAVAGPANEKCVAEEKALRQKTAEKCSGIAYLLNPSGCYASRKALARFDDDACRKGEPDQAPAPPSAVKALLPLPAAASQAAQSAQPALKPEPAVEQLAAENSRLKEENARLVREIERIRKNCTGQQQ